MTTERSTSEEAAERIEYWLQDHYAAYREGIESVIDTEDGACLELTEPVDIGRFVKVIEAAPDYEPDRREDDSVSVLKVEELEGGLLHKHAIGVTFHKTDRIPLGGYVEPIEPDGEPADDTTEETLMLLVTYLEDKYM